MVSKVTRSSLALLPLLAVQDVSELTWFIETTETTKIKVVPMNNELLIRHSKSMC